MARIIFILFLFSTPAFAGHPFNLKWEVLKKTEINIRERIRTIQSLSFEFREDHPADYLMFHIPTYCNVRVLEIRTENSQALFVDQLSDSENTYVLTRFPEKQNIRKLYTKVEANLAPRPFARCVLSFYTSVGSSGGDETPSQPPSPPVTKDPEYFDCAKVAADIQFYHRDLIEVASVLEDVVNGKPMCQVFVRFETVQNLLKFHDARKKEGKDSEYELLKNPNNETVKVDIVLKVSQN